MREYADFLEAHVDAWTVTTHGSLDPEVTRHYIRVNPDATDKLTLPAGSNGEFPLVGDCFTSAFVIHLRAIPAGDHLPPGYQSTGWTTGGAVVYYALTRR